MSTQQTVGIVSGAVGIVGIGVGSFFGIRALKKSSEADSHCPKSGFCNDDEGLELTKEGQDQAAVANIGFAVGGGLLALGAVLYLTGAPRSEDRVALVPVLVPGSASANVVGRF
jgi:serine/threonine-protein kinase